MPVFRFVKDALIRVFGSDFYSDLEGAYEDWKKGVILLFFYQRQIKKLRDNINNMEQIKTYIESNKERFLGELSQLIRIPSVSSSDTYRGEMVRAAEKVMEFLLEAGAETAEIKETTGHPVVYAEKKIDPTLPTVLVYGHYDVQPAEPLELWITPPFEPAIREGKIYARGADDDKGQLFMHVKAFEFMNRHDKLPCNVKFMIEGEEEIGSPSLKQFCYQNKELLKSDVILISDTTMISMDVPSITTGIARAKLPGG